MLKSRAVVQTRRFPGRKTYQAMVGLLEEGQGLMEEEAPESVMDAALIAAAQKVEHYEMATRSTAGTRSRR